MAAGLDDVPLVVAQSSRDFWQPPSLARMIAEQLTLIDSHLIGQLRSEELEGAAWTSSDKATRAPTICALTSRFNRVGYWVATEVLLAESVGMTKCQVIRQWIQVMTHLRDLHNFNSLKAVIAGLENSSIYNLKSSWADVSKEDMSSFTQLRALMSHSSNHKLYRAELRSVMSEGSHCVPVVVVHLRDLFVAVEKKAKSTISELIGFMMERVAVAAKCSLHVHKRIHDYVMRADYIQEAEMDALASLGSSSPLPSKSKKSRIKGRKRKESKDTLRTGHAGIALGQLLSYKDFWSLSPKRGLDVVLAEQLTHLESQFLSSVQHAELAGTPWLRTDAATVAPNVVSWRNMRDKLRDRFVSQVLMASEHGMDPTTIVSHLLGATLTLFALHNYDGVVILIAALTSPSVACLPAWEQQEAETLISFSSLAVSMEDTSSEYAMWIAQHRKAGEPCIPILDDHLNRMAGLWESGKTLEYKVETSLLLGLQGSRYSLQQDVNVSTYIYDAPVLPPAEISSRGGAAVTWHATLGDKCPSCIALAAPVLPQSLWTGKGPREIGVALAHQLTAIVGRMFRAMSHESLMAWRSNPSCAEGQLIQSYVDLTKRIVAWQCSEILLAQTFDSSAHDVLCAFVHMADCCATLRNAEGFMLILHGMRHQELAKRTKVWEGMNTEHEDAMRRLIYSYLRLEARGHARFPTLMSCFQQDIDCGEPCIPYLSGMIQCIASAKDDVAASRFATLFVKSRIQSLYTIKADPPLLSYVYSSRSMKGDTLRSYVSMTPVKETPQPEQGFPGIPLRSSAPTDTDSAPTTLTMVRSLDTVALPSWMCDCDLVCTEDTPSRPSMMLRPKASSSSASAPTSPRLALRSSAPSIAFHNRSPMASSASFSPTLTTRRTLTVGSGSAAPPRVPAERPTPTPAAPPTQAHLCQAALKLRRASEGPSAFKSERTRRQSLPTQNSGPPPRFPPPPPPKNVLARVPKRVDAKQAPHPVPPGKSPPPRSVSHGTVAEGVGKKTFRPIPKRSSSTGSALVKSPAFSARKVPRKLSSDRIGPMRRMSVGPVKRKSGAKGKQRHPKKKALPKCPS